jgi:DNA-binding beta-propeller fold protein YncE
VQIQVLRSSFFARRRNLAPASLCVLTMVAVFAVAVGSASAALPPSFGEGGSKAGQFEGPRGVAVATQTGDAYVADRENNRIDKFGPQGEFLLAFGWGVGDGTTQALQTCTTSCFKGLAGPGAGQLSRPAGIAVDNDATSPSYGDVYVVDSENHRIQKFGPDGEFELMLGGGVDQGPNHPGNICTPAFVSEGDSCGAGASGSGPGEFVGLESNSIAVGPASGSVYVGDEDRVQRFGTAGTLEAQIALPGVGFPRALAVDSVGDLYVASFELEGVHKYDGTGAELGTPRDEGAERGAFALATGPSDQLFVNDYRGGVHHILAFDSTGGQISSFDAGGEAEDGSPGIAYGQTLGALYVLTEHSVRIVGPPPPGPLILAGSESATEIGTRSATLDATINPEGVAGEYTFQYVDQHSFETEGGFAGPNTVETTSASLGPVDEIQSVTIQATVGSYLLRFRGEASAEIPLAATAAEVQADLEAVPSIGAGNVAVGGPEAGPYAVEFTGTLGGSAQPALEAESINLKIITEVEGEERIKPGSVSVTTTRRGSTLFDDQPVSVLIESLQPATTYHFRVLASNTDGSVEGPDQTFTTLPPVSIESVSASQVTATSATLLAELNPHGLPTSYHFEYDTAPYAEGEGPHGVSVPLPEGALGADFADHPVAAQIQGLQALTTYHYRVVAHNSLGSVDSPDRTFTTQGAASILPDGREWELVSPPDKHGSPLEAISEEGADIQAAADGSGLAYAAKGPVGPDPAGVRSPQTAQLIAARGPSGWSTEEITTPYERAYDVQVGVSSEYKLFSEDLSLGLVEPLGATPLSPATSERTPYLRLTGGEYVPLVTGCPPLGQVCPPAVEQRANVSPGTSFGGVLEEGHYQHGLRFLAASPDLKHLVFSSPEVLTPGFSSGFVNTSGQESLYEYSAGSLRLLSVLPDGEAAVEAEEPSEVGFNITNRRGAVSENGNRVVFNTSNSAGKASLYLRDVGLGQTLRLDTPQPGVAPGGGPAPVYQGASSDAGKIFFTDEQQLTPDASPSGSDLYMCEITVVAGNLSCSLSDLSVDHNPGEAANVFGSLGLGRVSAIDAAGTHVYFVADGVLTATPDARGEHAVPGDCESAEAKATCNLYVHDTVTGRTSLVAVLSATDAPDWQGAFGNIRGMGNLTARVSPDGRYFAFMSQRPLTGYDNRDARSGAPDAETYLFDSAADGGGGAIVCVSCDPTGARPLGIFDPLAVYPGPLVDLPYSWAERWIAGSIPGWTTTWNHESALYQSRYLSDSGRLFFNAADALVPKDTNGVEDVYEYEPPGIGGCSQASPTFGAVSGGCVGLISSGTSPEESAFLDASESGDDVFFLTASRLTSTDVDGSLDIYDAHVCSAASPCPPAPAPPAPACTGDACQLPATPPADATPGSLTFNGAGNVTECPKGKVKQKGRCVKKQQKKKGKKQKKGHKKSPKQKGKKQKSQRHKSKRGGHK